MDFVENAIENDLAEYFTVDSILGGNNNLKVRIDDQELGFERIINCMFRHHHTDERYGNVHIDLVTTGLGIQTKKRTIGKFGILDRETIKNVILKNVIDCVKTSA